MKIYSIHEVIKRPEFPVDSNTVIRHVITYRLLDFIPSSPDLDYIRNRWIELKQHEDVVIFAQEVEIL